METQAFRLASVQTIAPPGGKISRVIRPAVDMPPDSKRGALIEKAEDDLENEMEGLKEGTRIRNLEIETKLESIREHGREWTSKLENYKTIRDQEHEQVLKKFKDMFTAINNACSTETTFRFNHILENEIPPECDRELDLNGHFRTFVDITVPDIIEKLQGNVTRKLKKSHETFDIDNAKLMKREKRIVDRFDLHTKTTKKAFDIETKKRLEKFLSMHEEMQEVMRVDDRVVEMCHGNSMRTVQTLQKELKTELQVREEEDMEILEKLATAMSKLQSSILNNFGSEANNEQPSSNNMEEDQGEEAEAGEVEALNE